MPDNDILLTGQQRKALHKFYELLAVELNSAGLDQRLVLKPSISIPWTKESVKNQLWRPVQDAMLGKHSTEDMNITEVNIVYEALSKGIGEKFKVHVKFPSEEEDMTKTLE